MSWPQAVLVPSDTLPETPAIRGWDFNQGCDLDGIMDSMYTTGFQGTTFGQAIREVNRMVSACVVHASWEHAAVSH